LFYNNINSKTSIQQHILHCILPNLYLDNYHMIIYCYNSCPYFWYWKTNLFIYDCSTYILNFLLVSTFARDLFSSGAILNNCPKFKV
jgi:hypothetical protein